MSAHSHSGRLTSTDASFFYLEREQAPMHIGAVAILDGELPYEAYVESVRSKLFHLPRFRERAVATPYFLGHPTWETDPDFDIYDHIRLHSVPAPGGEQQLRETANRIIAQMLERGKPLWELHILHGLANGDSAIVSKVHHAMVDGVGGNQILTTILDLYPDQPVASNEEDTYEPTEPAGRRERIFEALWDQARTTIDSINDYQRKMIDLGRNTGREQLRNTIDVLRKTMPDLAFPPKRLPFNKKCGGEKNFVWTRFSFAEARAVRSALGGTVNDVILACLGDAVGRYCRTHDIDTKGRMMRLMVPVNLRPENATADLGNLVSVLPVDVPIGAIDPSHRIGVIRESTRTLKRGRVAESVSLMTDLMGVVPVPFQAAFGSMAVSPFPIFNMVCTNVPGPQIPLYANGHLLKAYYPYVPTGFDMGVGCAIFSYNQALHIGLNSDTSACPDVELLRDCFDDAITEIKSAAGVADIPVVSIGLRPRPESTASQTAPGRVAAAKDETAGTRKKTSKRKTARKPSSKKAKVSKKAEKSPARKKRKRKTSQKTDESRGKKSS